MNPAALAIFAYVWWGLVPLYWKQLQAFSSYELIIFRVIFSSLFLIALIFQTKKWNAFLRLKDNKRASLALLVSGILIGLNWYLYVWAVNHGHIVDASLGYFMNPLINVALGAIFLKERLRKWQKVACLMALLGTGSLIYFTGVLPWIALALASSFGCYGLLRKFIQVDTISGTLWETILLLPFALLGLLWQLSSHQSHTISASQLELVILVFCGAITTIPLLAFAEAAKALSLTSMGFIQFISPTLQFLLGVILFHEAFDLPRIYAFVLIWLGIGFFLLDLYLHAPKKAKTQ